MPNFKELVKKRSQLVGNYRTAHARLIAHAEEIAFYEGGPRERSIIRQRFDAVYWHMRHMATKSAAVGFVDTWIEKYGASIAGYFIMCLPVFSLSRALSPSLSLSPHIHTLSFSLSDCVSVSGILLDDEEDCGAEHQ